MKHLTWSTLVLAALLASAVASVGAQARLPFQAYGAGLHAGAVIEAVHNGTTLAKTTADAEGTWVLQLSPDSSADGDEVGFRVDGTMARETIVFRSARFVRPPGLALTYEGQPAPAKPAPGQTPGTVPGQAASPSETTTGSSLNTSMVLLAAGIGAVILGAVGFVMWRRRAV